MRSVLFVAFLVIWLPSDIKAAPNGVLEVDLERVGLDILQGKSLAEKKLRRICFLSHGPFINSLFCISISVSVGCPGGLVG